MPKAAPLVQERRLTLEDYLAHQHALRTLQQSHAVWIVDDILGLRYRARLRLCLFPTRRLLLTDDSSEAGDIEEKRKEAVVCNEPSSSLSSSIVIPLVPACKIDVCTLAVNSDECGLRFTFPVSLAVGVDATTTGKREAAGAVGEASYFVLPITSTLGASTAPVTQAWDAVLHSLCNPPGSVTEASVARTSSKGAVTSSQCHLDPGFVVAPSGKAASVYDTARSAGRHSTVASTLKLGASKTTVDSTAAPSPSTAAAFTAKSREPSDLQKRALPQTTNITTITSATSTSSTAAPSKPYQSVAKYSSAAAITTPMTTGSNVSHEKACLVNNTNNGDISLQHFLPHGTASSAAAGTTATAWQECMFGEPPPRRPAPPTVDTTRHDPDCDDHAKHAKSANEDAAEQDRFCELTSALRSRTREAAQLAEHLRSSLSPSRRSPSHSSPVKAESVATTAVDLSRAEEAHELDSNRPPTMAHISSGLVPALRHFNPLPSIISSTSSEGDGGAEGDSTLTSAGQTGLMSDIGAIDMSNMHGVGGVGGNNGGSYANSADSPRPQAPRSGHVCNLGSIGPSCGDEEALRIYNEIHGSHSSCSSRPSSAATTSSSAGLASSFRSSAYGTAEGVAGRGQAK